MTDREKLVDIMRDSKSIGYWWFEETIAEFADHLLANGVTVQRWIPVSERLPSKEFDWVLVACKIVPEGEYGVPHIAEIRHGVWYADCYEVPLESAGTEVTHWMPLPEPPKEDET